MGNNYIFIENFLDRKTYSLIDKFKVLVGIDSTLNYENFGRGNKTAFFSYRSMKYPFDSRKFGWPLQLKLNNKFWTAKKDYKNFKKILSYTINCKDNEWQKNFRKYYKSLMYYDKNNLYFKKLIKKLLKEN